MTWKIWQWPAEIRQLRKNFQLAGESCAKWNRQYDEAVKEREKWQTDHMNLSKRLEELNRRFDKTKEMLDGMTQAYEQLQHIQSDTSAGRFLEALEKNPLSLDRIEAAFCLATDENQLWQGVHTALHNEIGQAELTVCMAASTSEARHYNAGRLAGLLDFQQMLLDLRTQAMEKQRASAV